MRFVDEVTVEVRGGDGGNGAVAFRREKHVAFGGPAGGDGGNGGDIVFIADTRMSTLLDLRNVLLQVGERGENGRGKDQYGKGGATMEVRVPVGTQVFDGPSGDVLADLDEPGSRFVVARGGRGGRGNIHFATPQDRAPRRAEPGEPGESRKLRLELKLLADVGLVGFPNVGKSTLIARISRARPKIADYPFTTLVPNLGVVALDEDRSCVVADIPGLVEGAADGHGLGHRFLRHVERTRVMLHIVTLDPDPDRAPLKDFDVLRRELERFDPELAQRPALVAVSKIDLPDVKKRVSVIKRGMKKRGIDKVLPFSAATGEGIEALLFAIGDVLSAHPEPPAPRARPLLRESERDDESDADDDDEIDPAEGEGELRLEYVE